MRSAYYVNPLICAPHTNKFLVCAPHLQRLCLICAPHTKFTFNMRSASKLCIVIRGFLSQAVQGPVCDGCPRTIHRNQSLCGGRATLRVLPGPREKAWLPGKG